MPINYSWKDISEATIDKDGIKITVEKEPATEESPMGEGELPPEEQPIETRYPKPVSTDSLDITLDEANFVFKDDGHLVIPDVVIAKEIVQDYNGTMVYKSADEIKAMMKFLDRLPITNGHPGNDSISTPGEIKGFCTNPRLSGESAVVDLEISCPILIGEIKAGDKREVSIGFNSDLPQEGGTFGDTPYTLKQTNILPNHVAIVKDGRCSLVHGCGIPSEVLGRAREVVADKKDKVIADIFKLSQVKSIKELQTDSLKKLTADFDYLQKINAEAGVATRLKTTDAATSTRKQLDKLLDGKN